MWKKIWQNNVQDLQPILRMKNVSSADIQCMKESGSFPISIPQRLFRKIKAPFITDPIFRQFVPLREEGKGGGKKDPLEEKEAKSVGCMLKKYQGRVLLCASGACAMHCRYCFRKHTVFSKIDPYFSKELEYIKDHTEIGEVILSGGDPLSLSNKQIQYFISHLEKFDHVRSVRFHTRFPIGIPERIDEGFLEILYRTRLQKIFVFHINHMTELDEEIVDKFILLQKIPCMLLSQTVLLKGVNDTVDSLKELFIAIGASGVVPYYLHAFDEVLGAMHYDVPIEQGYALMKQLHADLPGYLLPRFVKEVPGDMGKRLLFPSIL